LWDWAPPDGRREAAAAPPTSTKLQVTDKLRSCASAVRHLGLNYAHEKGAQAEQSGFLWSSPKFGWPRSGVDVLAPLVGAFLQFQGFGVDFG
jgi:hypothetical protein